MCTSANQKMSPRAIAVTRVAMKFDKSDEGTATKLSLQARGEDSELKGIGQVGSGRA